MQKPAIPQNELARLDALRNLNLLDTPAEQRFDRLTRLAKQLFDVPIALVSLVDSDRQWFKSKQGLNACETGRDISFCGHSILEDAIFEICDATQDERFSDNPLVTGPPDIRFYAGAPLSSPSGQNIGTLCIIDTKPRKLSENERISLRDLANLVEQECLNVSSRMEEQEQQYRSLVNNIPGVTYRCLLDAHWTMLYMSDQVDPLSGYPAADFIHNAVRTYASVIHPDDADSLAAEVTNALQTNSDEWRVEYRIMHRDGSIRWVHERGSARRDQGGDVRFLDGFILDITERKRADEVLQHQRWLYETILEHSLAGYWDWNIPSATEYLSPTFKQMFGYQDSEMENSPDAWQKIIFPEDLPRVLKNFDDHIASRGKVPFDNEVRYHHKDGGTVWVRCTGKVVEWNTSGAPLRMVGCHVDITSHKNSASQIQRQLEAFSVLNQLAATTNLEPGEQISRALCVGTAFLDLELGIVSRIRDKEYQIRALHAPPSFELSEGQRFVLSDTYCDLVIQRRDLVSIHHMNHSEHRGHPCYQVAGLESYIGIGLEVEGQPYGTLNFSSPSPRSTNFSEADILFMRLLARWVAATIERERAARAIKQSEARLRGLFELSPIGIALNDFETGEFLDLNPALIGPSGYTRDEFVKLSYWEITPHEYEDQEQAQLESLRTTGRYGPFEKEYIRKDGSRYPVLLNGMVVHDPSGRKLIWSIVEDISERKHMEHMKNEFVSVVSHELRTPLTAISGALSLLVNTAKQQLNEQSAHLFDIAMRNSQRLSTLINDLLDIEKLSSGKMQFNTTCCALLPVIELALENHQTYGAERNVRLVLLDSIDAKVQVDQDRLMQVLANLLSNAIKFSPQARQVEISIAETAGWVRVSITDHGPGIPTAYRDRIFEKFSQADSSDARQKGGTGLGLAITRELIQRMGGRIGFDSEEGAGATFWFELAIDKSPSTLQAPITNERVIQPVASTQRILVVEDDPDIAAVLDAMFSQAGYLVDLAYTGQQALAALQEQHYAALSLDLMLPDISGLEIIRQVRQHPDTAQMPIVVVSATMEAGRLAINGDFSGIEWQAKPINEHALLSSLKRLIAENDHKPHILYVEDNQDLHLLNQAMLGNQFDITTASSVREAYRQLNTQQFDAIMLDIDLPDGSGWDLVPAIRNQQPKAGIIIVTGTEVSNDAANKVEAVLFKSKASSEDLLAALTASMRQ